MWNIDFYDVVIDDLETKQVYHSYLAFNIVGRVIVADLGKSKFSAPEGQLVSIDFETLSLDEQRVQGASLFRLAESVNGIVGYERIKAAAEEAGIRTVTFLRPDEWVG